MNIDHYYISLKDILTQINPDINTTIDELKKVFKYKVIEMAMM